ncbi:MAG: hypothetical protein CVV49_03535 [Spirochaetae bacterium HGW-Spirochaetae-5]|nr:MAG: hypothetical protein CVV49_03535 [Spirochaetae bacterium HGW-Spirochaetae-5]
MRIEKPLVTIVTITFNIIKSGRKDYFKQCLESVHNQTYPNIEHLVVDGASFDGTSDLIQEYADKGWVKYICEPDTGIYDAMNKGIKNAKGKYIAFLHSDDFYHGNDGIECTIAELEKTNADFSYAPAVMMKKDGSYDYNNFYCKPQISVIFYCMPFCHQTMFTKRTVLLKENMFNDNFKSAGDYDLIIRLCLNNYKSIFVDNLFTTFRDGGISANDNELSYREVWEAYYKNYNYLCSISIDECKNIYEKGYENIPLKLAVKLKLRNNYFNYYEYLANRIFIKKVISIIGFQIKKRLRQILRKIYCFLK